MYRSSNRYYRWLTFVFHRLLVCFSAIALSCCCWYCGFCRSLYLFLRDKETERLSLSLSFLNACRNNIEIRGKMCRSMCRKVCRSMCRNLCRTVCGVIKCIAQRSLEQSVQVCQELYVDEVCWTSVVCVREYLECCAEMKRECRELTVQSCLRKDLYEELTGRLQR